MSWESTVIYYQLLNRLARDKLGGLHSADLLLWSFDFALIEKYQSTGDWTGVTKLMVDAARSLERGGAECIVICTNTMHKMAGEVAQAVDIPLIHIADATAAAINKSNCNSPLLLATAYTMEQDFYKGHLRDNHNIKVTVPNTDERSIVHNIIYDELCRGVVSDDSKAKYLEIVNASDADSVIFGCTEVGLLLSQDDLSRPVFDTTYLHAEAALKFALE